MTDVNDMAGEPAQTPAPASTDEAQAAGTDKFGRQLYKAACAKCGGEASVPFKPSSGRPVYCQNCYKPRPRRDFGGGGGDRMGGGRGFQGSR